MDVNKIAEICHMVNRAYCQSLGDTSQAAWTDAPDWQKKSAVSGVENVLRSPSLTPEDSHQNWMDEKTADGWTYGEVKDEVAKTHPCMVPFAELPQDQKAKDYLFVNLVHELRKLG